MAKYNFKQAALLGGGLGLQAKKGADGKPLKVMGGGHRHLYPKGIHEVKDEKHLSDPTFVHLAKHGLIEKVSAKDGPKELKPASSPMALASQKAAKSQTGGDVSPDDEIGGDDDEPTFEDVPDDEGGEELSEEEAEAELGEGESEEGEEVVDGEPTFEGDGDGAHQAKKKKKKKKRG